MKEEIILTDDLGDFGDIFSENAFVVKSLFVKLHNTQ